MASDQGDGLEAAEGFVDLVTLASQLACDRSPEVVVILGEEQTGRA